MKRMIIIIISTIVLSMLFIPVVKYIHAKTIGKDSTDCMVTYIQKYYPIGATYVIFGTDQHIDKDGIGNEYMIKTGNVNGCIFTGQSLAVKIFNTQYCYTTLALESIQ